MKAHLRKELLRAVGAALKASPERATGKEALEALMSELEGPHDCRPAYQDAHWCGVCDQSLDGTDE